MSLSRYSKVLGLCKAAMVLGLFALARPASAHFVWVDAESTKEGTKVLAGFGEVADWDASLAERIKQAKYYVRDAEGNETPVTLAFDETEDCYVGKCDAKAPFAVLGTCDYGTFQRGDAPTMMLRYYAKTLVGAPESWSKSKGSKSLEIEVTPVLKGDEIVLEITTQKGSAPEKVSGYGPQSERVTLEVKDGKAVWPSQGPGRYSLFVGHKLDENGTVDGKEYTGASHYATLMFTIPGEKKDVTEKGEASDNLPMLPEAVSSFGAAVADGYLYVYSGHTGGAHRHSLANLSKHFRRAKLEPGAEWEELPSGTQLQGMPMVPYQGKLYRVGGLTAKNETTEQESDLLSVKEFACFDPQAKTWTALPELPEGRSSHDAVVIGDKLYVVGGWNLGGGEETWHVHSLVYDLKAENAGWEKLPEQPFERRALTAGTYDGKLYAIGGMDSSGEVQLEVDIFDPATGAWSKGPAIPSVPEAMSGGMGRMSGINGFGSTAWNLEGRLYLGTYSGQVFMLNKRSTRWKEVATLALPRFFHRLLPLNDHQLIAVGGASMSGHVRVTEIVDLEQHDHPTVNKWAIPHEFETDHSQAIAFNGGTLQVFGGNKSAGPHDFEAENFSPQSFSVSLSDMKVEELPALPTARQSSAVINQRLGRRDARTLVIGGMGNDGSGLKGLTQVASLKRGEKEWTIQADALPDTRSLFGVAEHDKKVWLFGGMIPGQRGATVEDVLVWEQSEGDVKFVAAEGVKLPRSRRSFAGTVHGDKYYLVGGIAGNGPVAELDVFDFKTKAWETVASPAAPRIFAQMVEFDGKLYLVGGVSPSEESHFAPNKTIEVFDPAKGEWSTLEATLPEVGKGMQAFAAGYRIGFVGLDPSSKTVQVAFLKP